MVGFASRSGRACKDEVPLNKSFDTETTSDAYIAENDSNEQNPNFMTVWGMHRYSLKQAHNELASQTPSQTTFSTASTTKAKNTGQSKGVERVWRPDFTNHYSPRLGIAFESADGLEVLHDESEPRATIVLPNHNSGLPIHQDESVEIEFYDNMIPMGLDLAPHWQGISKELTEVEDSPSKYDEIWRKRQEQALETKESMGNVQDEAHAILLQALDNDCNNGNEVVWTPWGFNDRKTRHRVVCLVSSFLIVVGVIAFVASLLNGNSNDSSSRIAALDGSRTPNDDFPNGYPDSKPVAPQPTPSTQPILQPSWSSNLSTEAPTEATFLLTKRPVLDMVPPDNPVPTSAPVVSPSVPGSAPSTRRPTRNPTAIPTNSPTERRTGPPGTYVPTTNTSSPTRQPSSTPVPRPDQPTPCQSTLRVDKECYIESDTILVELNNCDPQEDDWVGIWWETENPAILSDNFVAQVWSCGTPSCLGAATTKNVDFSAYELGYNSFRAFLVHEQPGDAPYVSVAMSEPFLVSLNCDR